MNAPDDDETKPIAVVEREGAASSFEDGRNIDPRRGMLSGEGAQQWSVRLPERAPTTTGVPPVVAPSTASEPSYYGLPMVKEPVWIWTIPVYFYVGGIAGASATLAGAAQLSGAEELRPLVRKLRWVTAVGGAIGGALLIADLGRPERFLNMLRVFRPTSPMSLGSWMLAGLSTFGGLAALLGNARQPLRGFGDAAGLAAAAIAVPFTGYTAVLLGNTAVPAWQGARRTLPVVFVASSMSSAAALTEFVDLGPRARRTVRRFGIAGRAIEVATAGSMVRESRVPEVQRHYQQGSAAKLLRVGTVMNVAALVLSLFPDRIRNAHRAAGLLGNAAALATKWGVFLAGRASTLEPQASIKQQRSRQGA